MLGFFCWFLGLDKSNSFTKKCNSYTLRTNRKSLISSCLQNIFSSTGVSFSHQGLLAAAQAAKANQQLSQNSLLQALTIAHAQQNSTPVVG